MLFRMLSTRYVLSSLGAYTGCCAVEKQRQDHERRAQNIGDFSHTRTYRSYVSLSLLEMNNSFIVCENLENKIPGYVFRLKIPVGLKQQNRCRASFRAHFGYWEYREP